MKIPRISFKKGIALSEIKKLYPDLQVRPIVLNGKEYLHAQANLQGVGVLVFIFCTQEQLIEFEVLPLQQE